jgi:hypothetical protein
MLFAPLFFPHAVLFVTNMNEILTWLLSIVVSAAACWWLSDQWTTWKIERMRLHTSYPVCVCVCVCDIVSHIQCSTMIGFDTVNGSLNMRHFSSVLHVKLPFNVQLFSVSNRLSRKEYSIEARKQTTTYDCFMQTLAHVRLATCYHVMQRIFHVQQWKMIFILPVNINNKLRNSFRSTVNFRITMIPTSGDSMTYSWVDDNSRAYNKFN